MTDRTSRRRYGFGKAAVLILIVLYVPLAVHGGTQKREHFPIFNWSLFSHTSNNVWKLEVEVLRLGDRVFDPPAFFYDLGDEFRAAQRADVAFRKAVGRWYKEQYGRTGKADQVRRAFERNYLSHPEEIEYQIVAVRFNALERRRTGAIKEKQIVGKFVLER